MSIPIGRMVPPRDGTLPGPRSRRPCSSLFMRGLRLGIPFEPRTPVEGAILAPEDFASRTSRRPSPGTSRRLLPSTRLPLWTRVFGETDTCESYKDLERAAGELLYARVWNVQLPAGAEV